MSRSPAASLAAVAAMTVALVACSGSPEVEVVARDVIATTTTTTTTTSTVPSTTVPTTTTVPSVDVEPLDGVLDVDESGQHVSLVIDGVRAVEDQNAWSASWQTLNGLLLADHLDQQSAGWPPGIVIMGAPTLRTERRAMTDGIIPLSGEVVEDRYDQLVEMPDVGDPTVASAYIVDAVAEAVAELGEYPNRRQGEWQSEQGSYVELAGDDVAYDISVVPTPLPQSNSEDREVLRLSITRTVAADLVGADLQVSMFDPLRESFDRLGIATDYEVVDVSRDVSTLPYTPVEAAMARTGATVIYAGVAAGDLDALLVDVATSLGADFERSDEYEDLGEVWFNPTDRLTGDGSYVISHVGSELEVTLVSRLVDLPAVESDPPAQSEIVGSPDHGAEPDDAGVVEFEFDGLSPLDADPVGPADLLAGVDIAGMDPPIVVPGAPITFVDTEVYDPEFDPDTGVVTSAAGYEVEYSQAIQVEVGTGDVRQSQLDIQEELADLLAELDPGEPLVEDSYEIFDGRFSDAVVVGSGFPQRLTVAVSPLDPSDETESGALSFYVRRYLENPDPTLLGTRSDWIDADLEALIDVVEPAGPATIRAVGRDRFVPAEASAVQTSSAAELELPPSTDPAASMAAVTEAIEGAGYQLDQSDQESASFVRPEAERQDRFFVFSQPGSLTVFVDTDPVEE